MQIAQGTILLRAFCNTCGDFDMEKTVMYESNISWEVTTPKYKEHQEKNMRGNNHLNVFCCKRYSLRMYTEIF